MLCPFVNEGIPGNLGNSGERTNAASARKHLKIHWLRRQCVTSLLMEWPGVKKTVHCLVVLVPSFDDQGPLIWDGFMYDVGEPWLDRRRQSGEDLGVGNRCVRCMVSEAVPSVVHNMCVLDVLAPDI
jgi:hypothetical protein